MKPVRFQPEAEAEMIEAARWYEAQQAGLGSRTLTTVQDAVNRVGLDPLLYPAIDGDARRCLTRTFPFGLVFRVQADGIAVIAVMHLLREPGYWQDRRTEDLDPGGGP